MDPSYTYKYKKHFGIKLDHSYGTLAMANDRGATFKEIATFIRKYPEAVFTE